MKQNIYNKIFSKLSPFNISFIQLNYMKLWVKIDIDENHTVLNYSPGWFI